MPAIIARALRVADAAAVLHGDVERLDDALDDLEVGQLARPRGVEVDDVQRLGALVLPVPGELDGVVAEDGDIVEVAAAETDGLAGLDVDGGEHDHEGLRLPLDVGDERGEQREPDAGTLLRVELYRPDVVARHCRDDGPAVVRRRGDDGGVRGHGRVGVDEVDGGRGRQPAGHARAGRPPVEIVPADVRHLEAGAEALDGAGQHAEARPAAALVAALEEQLQAEAHAEKRRAGRDALEDGGPQAALLEPRGRVAEGAHAGQHDAVGVAHRRRRSA